MAEPERRTRWPALARVLPLVPVVAVLVWSGAAAAEHVARDVEAAWRALARALAAIAEVAPAVHAASDAGMGTRGDAGRPRVTGAPHVVRDVAPPTREEILDDVRAAFCPALAERLCGARERCGCFHEEPRCRDRVEAACSDHLARTYADGTFAIELAPEPLAGCLAGFAALGDHCDLDRAVVPGCAWPVREPVEVGAACEVVHHQCRGGRCDEERVCTAPARRGEPPTAAGCEVGLRDFDGQCQPPYARGAACTWAGQCARGSSCRRGVCAGPPGLREPCPSELCAAGLRCEYASGARVGTCVEGATWCSDFSQCGAGEVCDRRYACGPCMTDSCPDPTICEDGTRCATGTECTPVSAGRCERAVCLERSLVELVD